MGPSFISNWNTQTKKGMLIFLVLNILKKKTCYGHEIIREIEKNTQIKVADGTLYPLLKKLKKENLAITKWSVNERDAPRKYYYLTGIGNSTVTDMNKHWRTLNNSIANLLVD